MTAPNASTDALHARELLASRFDGVGLSDIEPSDRAVSIADRQRSRERAEAVSERIRAWIREPHQSLQLRPSISNASSASGEDVTGLTWDHTCQAGRTTYVVCVTASFDIDMDDTQVCTIGGVEATQWVKWSGFGASGGSVFGFSLTSPAAGEQEIVFTNDISMTAISGFAFNVANGPVNGCFVLPGGWYQDQWTGDPHTITKQAYAWDADGLQVAVFYHGDGAKSFSGATAFKSDTYATVYSTPATNGEIEFIATRETSGRALLFTFLIPSVSQQLTGGRFQPWFQASRSMSGFDPGDFMFLGLPYGSTGVGSLFETFLGSIIARPGTIRSLAVKSSVAPGSGNSITAELMRAGCSGGLAIGFHPMLPTGVTITISDDETQALLDDVDFPFYKYERLALRFTAAGGGALPAGISVTSSALVELGTSGGQVYGGGAMGFGGGSVDIAFKRAVFHPTGEENWSTFESSDKSLTPAGTFRELLVSCQVDVLATEVDFYYEVNGVLQDGTGGTVDTKASIIHDTLGVSLARRTCTLTVEDGDFVSVVGYKRSGGLTRYVAMHVFTPQDGGFVLSGGSDVSSGVSDFVALPNSSREQKGATSEEFARALIVPPTTASGPLRLSGLLVDLDGTAPGANKGWTVITRTDLADEAGMPQLALTGDDVRRSVIGDVALEGGQLLSLVWDAVSGPAAARQFWTFTGSVAPTSGVIGPHLWMLFNRTQPDEVT